MVENLARPSRTKSKTLPNINVPAKTTNLVLNEIGQEVIETKSISKKIEENIKITKQRSTKSAKNEIIEAVSVKENVLIKNLDNKLKRKTPIEGDAKVLIANKKAKISKKKNVLMEIELPRRSRR